MHSIWLVETQNKILYRIAILYYTSSVQVERQMACRVVRTLSTYSKSNTLAEAGAIERQLVLRLFVNFCDKNGDIFFDSRAIVVRLVVNGDTICNFIHAKREVWEKSVAND